MRLGAQVIGILGPTAVGKTEVAVSVAKLLGTRVISCDSMQLYRGFPVLTNQPTAEERQEVEHALVACLAPTEACSAAHYADLARPLVAEDLRRNGWALLAGGTGLYLRAVLAPLATAPRDEAVRAELERRAAAGEGATLYEELRQLDPVAAETIDPRNLRRVVRALEVARSGRRWSGRSDLWEPRYEHRTLIVGLNRQREELYRRIDQRARLLVEGGAVEEVRRFREQVGRAAAAPGGPGVRSAIGYREIWEYLEGARSLEETVLQVAAATRRYARRQLTWLRKVRGTVIIELQGRAPEETAELIVALARSGEAGRAGAG